MTVKAIPDGYEAVTPCLIVDGGKAALEFYAKAFGAVETMRMPMGDKIGHAEMKVGGGKIMLGDEWPDMNLLAPTKRGGTAVGLMIYVEDVDAAFKRAIDAGATQIMPVSNQFYGDRSGKVRDPYGHEWTLSTHIEDVADDEMKRRMEKWVAQQ